jgi:hypothetical protein
MWQAASDLLPRLLTRTHQNGSQLSNRSVQISAFLHEKLVT